MFLKMIGAKHVFIFICFWDGVLLYSLDFSETREDTFFGQIGIQH